VQAGSAVVTIAAGPLMNGPCRGAMSSLALWIVIFFMACSSVVCLVVAFRGAQMCASLRWLRNAAVGNIKAGHTVTYTAEEVSSVLDDIARSSPRVDSTAADEQRALLGRQSLAKQQLKRRPGRLQNSS
jgi:hypothetical protein